MLSSAHQRLRHDEDHPMTQPPAAGRHRAGMTLVEVLAVCVIIGILASLALPALARAIARSRVTQCTNNQYQVAFAL
ncbi:MAG: prepilin-type N-terminal cleavage/methylation domain-containing protein, partial [Planctomycetota bacterium]